LNIVPFVRKIRRENSCGVSPFADFIFGQGVTNVYVAGESFFKYYRRLVESVYKEKAAIELVT